MKSEIKWYTASFIWWRANTTTTIRTTFIHRITIRIFETFNCALLISYIRSWWTYSNSNANICIIYGHLINDHIREFRKKEFLRKFSHIFMKKFIIETLNLKSNFEMHPIFLLKSIPLFWNKFFKTLFREHKLLTYYPLALLLVSQKKRLSQWRSLDVLCTPHS